MKSFSYALFAFHGAFVSAGERMPLSDLDKQFSRDLVAAFDSYSTEKFEKLADPKAMMERIAVDSVFEGNAREKFIVIGAEKIKPSYSAMMDVSKRKKTVTIFKHKHMVGNEVRFLVRHKFNTDGGYAFTDFVVNENHKIVDWFVYAEATKATDSVRQAMAFVLKEEALFNGGSTPREKSSAIFKRYGEQMKAGQYEAAFNSLAELPEEYKRLRIWASLRVSMAGQFSKEKRLEALDYLYENFGSDPELQFVFIEHYFHKNQINRVITAIDNAQGAIGQDGEMQSMACGVLKNSGELQLALQRCQQALDLEPTVESAYWRILEIAFRQKDVALGIETLNAYERIFGHKPDIHKLATFDGYRFFSDTKEYRGWEQDLRSVLPDSLGK